MDSKGHDQLVIKPIGYISSCFKTKNGTPRQPSICPLTSGHIKIEKTIFTNPEHSLEGLKDFTNIWVLFHFHLNENKGIKAKVRPPRMGGSKMGVFSTRSPHRPNPIGLTLAKLVKVEGPIIHLSGVDLVDGTPIVDIKPYIEQYDFPKMETANCTTSPLDQMKPSLPNTEPKSDFIYQDPTISEIEQPKLFEDENVKVEVETSSWVGSLQPKKLDVIFTERAEKDLSCFKSVGNTSKEISKYDLKYFKDASSLRQAIIDILKEDPRSTYRRNKCSDRLYYSSIDNCHITAWFDYTTTPITVEVLRLKPLIDMSS